MFCLKCGSETENEQVFCNHCLETMEKHPVKPGTPVKIPYRDTNTASKKLNRRRVLTLEEQVIRMRVLVRTLIALLGAITVVLGIFVWLYFQQIQTSKDLPETSKGTNYTVIVPEGDK